MQDIPKPDASSLTSLTNWILGLLCVVGIYLYKLVETRNAKAIEDLERRLLISEQHYDQCNTERTELKVEHGKLAERVLHLERIINNAHLPGSLESRS